MPLLAVVVVLLAALQIRCDFTAHGGHNEHLHHDDHYDPSEDFDYGPDGYWTEWSDWGPCSNECEMNGKENKQYRTRDCIMPHGGHGRPCEGPAEDEMKCNAFPCERDSDPYWSVWSEWGPCSNDCQENGKKNWKKRSRTCIIPPYSYSGKTCKGRKWKRAKCNEIPCHTYHLQPYWSEWSVWGDCSHSCQKNGKKNWKIKSRVCRDASGHIYKGKGKPCKGHGKVKARCNRNPCYGNRNDAKWSKWTKWSKCPHDCEIDGKKNFKYRHRTCLISSHYYTSCEGRSVQRRRCNKINCHDLGKWTAWSEWGPCSHNCQKGSQKNFKYRTRHCVSKTYREAKCNGRRRSRKRCNKHQCHSNSGSHGY